MIRISQIKLDINHSEKDLLLAIKKQLKIKNDNDINYCIVKRSIDARKEDIKYTYTVDVEVDNEKSFIKKIYNKNITISEKKEYKCVLPGTEEALNRPVIIGSGPAGLFCAYILVQQGYKPLVIERGERVEDRSNTVETFFESGLLNPESNVQFGEGGAGTFSDGKLNTMVKDKFNRNDYVLKTFVKFGAPEDITFINKPHIGTDILKNVVKNMRNNIINQGGEFKFNTKFINFTEKNNFLCSVTVKNRDNSIEDIPTNICVLALGHSARDTFKVIYSKQLVMEPKSFAVGVRIEHLQDMINQNQYGKMKSELPAADYKVAKTLDNHRGVYSFCMCPGGYVVNASSEPEMTAVNGMSYSKRDGINSNSAMVVTVTPDDFENKTPLGGIEFQRKLERNAYRLGHGYIPVQTFGDYKQNVESNSFGDILPQTKGNVVLSNLRNVFPEYINQSIISGVECFSHQIKGFNRNDALLSGVESRTSSPLRICRNDIYESNISGIYPCGEGAGYAGGITSAAMDGIKVAEAIIKKFAPLTSV